MTRYMSEAQRGIRSFPRSARSQLPVRRTEMVKSMMTDISPVLAVLHWTPIKFRTEYEVLLRQGLAPSYLKELIGTYHPNRAVFSETAGLWFLEFPKVEWEAEASVFRLLSCATSSQLVFLKQTPSLC